MNDPLQLFGHAADALASGDWAALARFCDPASLTLFQREELQRFEWQGSQPEWTVDDILRHHPDMPREAAEYQLRQMQEHREKREDLETAFPGVAGVDDLRAMGPADFFATWLRGRSPEHQARLALADPRIPEEMRETVFVSASFRYQLVPLGVVVDGSRLAHVLYRMDVPPPPENDSERADVEHDSGSAPLDQLSPEEQALREDLAGREMLQVATCRKQPDGGWLLLAGHDFLQVGHYMVGIGI